jgi:hypothetical protein
LVCKRQVQLIWIVKERQVPTHLIFMKSRQKERIEEE